MRQATLLWTSGWCAWLFHGVYGSAGAAAVGGCSAGNYKRRLHRFAFWHL